MSNRRPSRRVKAYPWPRGSKEAELDYVLHGRFTDLPASRSNIVRIFTSSTFADMKLERNALMQTTYPKLKTYCREKYGLEFQVVDMRWGVRDDASDDHSTVDLCMKEIEVCRRVSVGPNFVMFIGQRYGWRPLPPEIPQNEWTFIKASLQGEDSSLLDTWYRRDENEIPARYTLQPISTYGESAAANWWTTESKLQQLLRKGVSVCVQKKKMKQEQGHKYFRSVTEQEIELGLFSSDSPDNHAICLMRTFKNFDKSHRKATRYTDLTRNGDIDEESQKLLSNLKNRIEKKLPRENIHKFRVDWLQDDGMDENKHSDYLVSFCKAFEESVKRLIDREAAERAVSDIRSELYDEVLAHAHLCEERAASFYGRDNILERIKNYMRSSDPKPLYTVTGDSGQGKTSILAKVATLIPEWLQDGPNVAVVLRFLGNTQESTNIFDTLSSICEQITQVFSLQKIYRSTPKSFVDLKEAFHKLIRSVQTFFSSRKLIIILDALGHLTASEEARNLAWLPTKQPPNVKILVSCHAVQTELLKSLQKSDFRQEHFEEITSLDIATSENMIKFWLNDHSKNITAEQFSVVRGALHQNTNPLYLSLIFDHIVEWHSYDVDVSLPKDVSECIEHLMKQTEKKHGEILVSHTMAYMYASKNGLTESELEDLLSLDDEVLSEVYQYHLPPMRRLPSVLLSRIRSDLAHYLVEREADGTKVLAWQHMPFLENVGDRYYNINENKKPYFLRMLYEYFSGKWGSGARKPFEYTKTQIERFKIEHAENEADRYVPDQPVMFENADDRSRHLNLRKISELPQALLQLHRHTNMLNVYADEVFLNLEFLMGLLHRVSWRDLLVSLIELTKSAHGDEERKLCMEMTLILHSLLLSGTLVSRNQSLVGPYISGRLLVYNAKSLMPSITRMIQQCDTIGLKYCALVPPHTQLELAGGDLLFTINEHHSQVKDMAFSSDERYVASVSKKVVVINMEYGNVTFSVAPTDLPPHDRFLRVCVIGDLIVTSLKRKPQVWVFSLKEGGSVLKKIDCKLERITNLRCVTSTRPDGSELHVAIVWGNKTGKIVFVDVQKGSVIREINNKSLISEIAVDLRANSCFVLLDNNGISEYDVISGSASMSESLPDVLGHVSSSSTFKGNLVIGYDEGNIVVVSATHDISAIGTVSAVVQHVSLVYGRIRAVVACTNEKVFVLRETSGSDWETKFILKKKTKGAWLVPNGDYLITVKGPKIDVFLLDYQNKQTQMIFGVNAHVRRINKIIPVLKKNDAQLLSCSNDGTVKMWDIVEEHDNRIASPTFPRSPSVVMYIMSLPSVAVAISSTTGHVSTWDVVLGNLVGKWQVCEDFIVSAACYEFSDSSQIVSVIDSRYVIHVRRFQSTQHPTDTEESRSFDSGCAPSEAFFQRVFCSPSHVIAIIGWRCVVIESGSFRESNRFDLTSGNALVRVNDACVDEQNNALVVLEAKTYCIHFYDVNSGEMLRTLQLREKHNVKNMETPYSLSRVLSSGDILIAFPYGLVAWRANSTDDVTDVLIPPDDMPGDVINVSNDGNIILMYDTDYLYVWNVQTKSQRLELRTGAVPSFAQLSPCGEYLVYVLPDSATVKLVRVSDGRELADYVMYCKVHSLSITSNSDFVLLGTEDRRVFVLAIVDPDVGEHKDRLSKIRSNAAILKQNAQLLAASYDNSIDRLQNADDEDDLDGFVFKDFDDDNVSEADLNMDLFQSGALNTQPTRKKQKKKTSKAQKEDSPQKRQSQVSEAQKEDSPQKRQSQVSVGLKDNQKDRPKGSKSCCIL